MSHVIKSKIKFKELGVLVAALQDCGMVFAEGQETYRWFGHSVGDYPIPDGWSCPRNIINKTDRILGRCDHAAQVEGSVAEDYELGIYREVDGSYGVIHDFYGRSGKSISHHVGIAGNNYARLEGAYALRMAELVASQQGWTTQRIDGGIVISIWDDATGQMGTVEVSMGGQVEASNFVGEGCTLPTQIVAEAIGVKLTENIKPEFHEQRSVLRME